MAVELFLQRDNNGLKIDRLSSDVFGHFTDVGIIQSGIYFIQKEEWRRMIAETMC